MCLVEGEIRGERREADCKRVAGCTPTYTLLCETKGGAIINDIVFILKGLTDALITLFFRQTLVGLLLTFFELLLTWTWGLGAKGLLLYSDLTCSTPAAAVSYGFAPFQILASPRYSSPSLLPACTMRRDNSPPNPAFQDHVRERGDQVFWEHTHETAASDDFLNDSLLPRPR